MVSNHFKTQCVALTHLEITFQLQTSRWHNTSRLINWKILNPSNANNSIWWWLKILGGSPQDHIVEKIEIKWWKTRWIIIIIPVKVLLAQWVHLLISWELILKLINKKWTTSKWSIIWKWKIELLILIYNINSNNLSCNKCILIMSIRCFSKQEKFFQ